MIEWPKRLTLRDTKVFADEGQRIFTTATGYGYEKCEYVRADDVLMLRDALFMLRNSVGDLENGFSKSVDPKRWVEQAQYVADKALNTLGKKEDGI